MPEKFGELIKAIMAVLVQEMGAAMHLDEIKSMRITGRKRNHGAEDMVKLLPDR
ncbi:hypothetical protein BACI349Y_620016 [Bacillus sp. 349Y]|nr:hypothetical protein BACI349Y_620016 [Bacillus sp. 349Y]